MRWIVASVTACVLSATALNAVIATHAEFSTSAKLIACMLLALLMAFVATMSALGGNELRKLARMTKAEREERAQERKKKAKEQETRSGIEMIAFFLGATGFFRTLGLSHEAQTYWMFGCSITGPILIAAAISMHHTRFFAFCAVGCVLSFVTGNPLAILIGIAGLVTLFKTDVQALFESQQQTALTARLHSATPTMEASRSYLPLGSRTIRHRWESFCMASSNWIRSWSESGLRIVRSFFLVIQLACMFLIFSFHVETNFSVDNKETLFTLGSPSPWFTTKIFQKTTEKEMGDGLSKRFSSNMQSGFNWSCQFQGVIIIVFLIAIATALLNWRIDLVTKPTELSRYRPASILKVWLLVLLAIAAFGMLMRSTHYVSLQVPKAIAP